jgi:hypothetical protein
MAKKAAERLTKKEKSLAMIRLLMYEFSACNLRFDFPLEAKAPLQLRKKATPPTGFVFKSKSSSADGSA